MSYGLKIEALMDGNHGLRLDGEVDLASAREFEQALAPLIADGGEILLDCTALTFMDSAGFRLLIEACEALPDGGGIVLLSPTQLISRTLELLGLERLPHLEVRYGPPQSSAIPGLGPGAAHRFELAMLTYASARSDFRLARLRTNRVLRCNTALRTARRELLASRRP